MAKLRKQAMTCTPAPVRTREPILGEGGVADVV
jgi:hypothetical protein